MSLIYFHFIRVRSEKHDQRTKKQQGRKKETDHDLERKKVCKEVQKGVQEFLGQ
jgi:hypothetical protein